MRAKPLITLILIGIVFAIAMISSNNANMTPVGTPRVYTTFITDNSTATPDLFYDIEEPPKIPTCLTQPLPVDGILVFRVWTWRADKELFRAETNGTNICQLTDNTVADDQPSLSPDGTKIAFVSSDSSYEPGIFTMNSDGTDRTQLTGGGSAYSFPDWSPDGKQLIFQATINELFDLYTINADGTDLRNLTNDVTLDTTPAWSPDGQRIAFASDRTFDPKGFVKQGNSFEIYVMNADGSDVRRLTSNDQTDIAPAWSPDGQRIAFQSDSEIKVIDANGYDLHQVTNARYSHDFAVSPIWLPDGQNIAFISAGTIYTINYNGWNLQRLAQGMSFAYVDGWWPS